MDFKVTMGQETSGTLAIYGDITRSSVRLYSSHPFLVWFGKGYDKEF